MKTVRYFLSCFVISLLSACISTKEVKEPFLCDLLQTPLKDFQIDIFGNIYTIDHKNRLKLYDADMNLLFEYYNNILGDITYVDVTNPKKIVLFFDGFQKMIFVDDTLAELGRYEGDFNIIAMGSSRDNNIWIYDGLDYRLKKISGDSKVLLESNPVESFHRLDIRPDYIIEHENRVYLVEENKGVAVFDNFGTYLEYFALPAYSLQLRGKNMRFVREMGVFQRNIENSFSEDQNIKALPVGVETAYIYKGNLFFLEKECLKRIAIN